MTPPQQHQTPLDLSPAEAAIADRYAAKWGCTRAEAVARMVSEQLRYRYVKARAPARVLPFAKR